MHGNGAGRVFLLYTNEVEAAHAKEELGKRKFGESVITSKFYPDAPFFSGVYNLP